MGCCGSVCEPVCNAIGVSCGEQEVEGARGINKDRWCTDIPCLLTFFLGIAGLLYIWSSAFVDGDIDRLLLPNDYKGNICGKGDMKDKTVGFWPDVNQYSFKMCAESCDVTSENWFGANNVDGNDNYIADTKIPYKSSETKLYCLPESGGHPDGYDDMTSQIRRQMEDMYEVMPIIGASAAIAIVMGFVFIFLMKKCLKMIVWLGVFMIVLGGGLCAAYLFYSAEEITDEDSKLMQQILAGVIAAFTLFFLLVVICLRSRIAIAIEVIKSAGRALTDVPLVVLTPFGPQAIAVTFVIVWVIATAHMFSLSDTYEVDTPEDILEITDDSEYGGNAVVNSYGEDFPTVYTRLDYNSAISNAFWFHFFMLLWILQTTTYFLYTMVAGVVADWYFTRREGEDGPKVRGDDSTEELPTHPILAAFCRTCKCFGSVVFASFMIAVIQFIRYVLRYMERQMRGNNACVQYFVCLIDCFLGCLESCMDCVSKRALIITAITGKPLCSSFSITFSIVWKNMCRVGVMMMFTSIVIFVGKVCICLSATGISIMIIIYAFPEVESIVLPAVVIVVLSFVIGSSFMTVYETAVDTVFLSFLLDEEWNAGKEDAHMFADKPLLDIIGKYEDMSKKVAEKEMGVRTKDGDDYQAAGPADNDAQAKDVGVKA